MWAPPGETAEVAAAQERIRKCAVAWWVFKVEQDGHQWLRDHPKYAERDVIAIEDSICRAKACSYWEWHRGSRIMWLRLPSEWQALFRDGPVLFYKVPLPKGFTQNTPSSSREVEIGIRKKIFKINFRGYSEAGFVDLVQGRFAISKVVRDGEVLDIRVV